MFYPVVLIGGTGSRLWPMSRTVQPKQLLPIASETHSMLQETMLRLDGLRDIGPALVICNHEHRFQVAEQLQNIGVAPRALVLEPVGRNTAPAVALAALILLEQDPEALLLALPSDHVIRDLPAFHLAIQAAAILAQQERIALLGIVPDRPDTGFGYIQRGTRLSLDDSLDDPERDEAPGGEAFEIARFVEKPGAETAAMYVASGDYLWNGGMFLARADVLVREMEEHAPQVLGACRETLATAYRDLDFLRLGREAFEACPSISIDYALLEKTQHAAVVPVDMGWSDVGSWTALWDLYPKDEVGNVRRGDVVALDTRGCLISAQTHLVATVGVEDLIIVEAGDAVLVAHKDRAQDVKKIVELLQEQGRSESEIHQRVYRPWGWYEGIDREERFQVKRIMVKPGAQLSLQRHYHRAEHWVVVSGTAEVVRGTETLLLSENQSIYIPLGMLHRLHNPGHIPLHLIEVQSGSYLGEDDIVRVEDHYGRLDDPTAHNKNGPIQNGASDLPPGASTDASAGTLEGILDTTSANSSMHPTIQASPDPGIQGGGLFSHMVSPTQPLAPRNPNRRRTERRGNERRSADRRRGERRTKAQIAADELAAQEKSAQDEAQKRAEVLALALAQAQTPLSKPTDPDTDGALQDALENITQSEQKEDDGGTL